MSLGVGLPSGKQPKAWWVLLNLQNSIKKWLFFFPLSIFFSATPFVFHIYNLFSYHENA